MNYGDEQNQPKRLHKKIQELLKTDPASLLLRFGDPRMAQKQVSLRITREIKIYLKTVFSIILTKYIIIYSIAQAARHLLPASVSSTPFLLTLILITVITKILEKELHERIIGLLLALEILMLSLCIHRIPALTSLVILGFIPANFSIFLIITNSGTNNSQLLFTRSLLCCLAFTNVLAFVGRADAWIHAFSVIPVGAVIFKLVRIKEKLLKFVVLERRDCLVETMNLEFDLGLAVVGFFVKRVWLFLGFERHFGGGGRVGGAAAGPGTGFGVVLLN